MGERLARRISQLPTLLTRRDFWQPALLFVVVYTSRLPLLAAGFGTDPDAWRVALQALNAGNYQGYQASRLPGFPLYELTAVLSQPWHPLSLNLVSAVCSAVATVLLYWIIRSLNGQAPALLSLSLSAIPIVYIHSTDSMDYLPALSLILGGTLAAIKSHTVMAGVLLGLATGFRISSLGQSLPIAVLLAQALRHHGHRTQLIQLGIFAITVTTTSLITFSPVWANYGLGFWPIYSGPLPNTNLAIELGTKRVWGSLGLFGILFALVGAIIRGSRSTVASISTTTAAGGVLLVYGLFLIMPMDPGYLIPAIPWLLILTSLITSPSLIKVAIALWLCAPWIEISNLRVLPGPILQEHHNRKWQAKVIDCAFLFAKHHSAPLTFILGPWLPRMNFKLSTTPLPHLHREYYCTAKQAKQFKISNQPLYYLPGIADHNRDFAQFDLTQISAKEICKVPLAR